jgi:hypothetical protein
VLVIPWENVFLKKHLIIQAKLLKTKETNGNLGKTYRGCMTLKPLKTQGKRAVNVKIKRILKR